MENDLAILLATTNPGKIVELTALFDEYAHLAFKLVTPHLLGINMEVKEVGRTYRENAEIKARAYSQSGRVITLADDSGLEVHALDGRPGLYSARYTGAGKTIGVDSDDKLSDADRRIALVDELKGYQRPWKARFCCAVTVAFPDGSIHNTEGICLGEIIPQERGVNGFGYDPIFKLEDPTYQGLTMAELSLQQKNGISHRAIAVRKAIALLEELIA